MSSFELPQDTNAGAAALPEHQEIVSTSFTFEKDATAGVSTPVVEAISGGNGAPFVLDAEKFKAMTPAESFALAGELVKRTRDEEVQKENAVVLAEDAKATEENKKEAEVIALEMAQEEAALVEKYGPKESWPEEAKQKSDLHRLGWGLAGVAGLTAIGGLAAGEANAFDLGGVMGGRASQGIQIEVNRANYQEQTRMQFEQQRMNVEMRIEQNRARMEQNFQRQEAQKNMQWENEYNQQTTDQARAQVKARQDMEWRNFANTVQMQRQQFESNADMQRQQLDMHFQARMQQVDNVSAARHRQATANAYGQVLNQGVYRVFGHR